MSRIIVPVSKAKPDQEWKNSSWPPRLPAGLHIPQSTKGHFGETLRYAVPPPPDDPDIRDCPDGFSARRFLSWAFAVLAAVVICLAVHANHPTPAHPLPKEPACLN